MCDLKPQVTCAMCQQHIHPRGCTVAPWMALVRQLHSCERRGERGESKRRERERAVFFLGQTTHLQLPSTYTYHPLRLPIWGCTSLPNFTTSWSTKYQDQSDFRRRQLFAFCWLISPFRLLSHITAITNFLTIQKLIKLQILWSQHHQHVGTSDLFW